MPRRQEVRSEETKAAILAAAQQLFSHRGYDAVTMREIAREAGCSHTTIYIYFKDKEALLHQLSMGPLQGLRDDMVAVVEKKAETPDNRLKQISRLFIEFCLENRTMYNIFFMVNASRVDEEAPALELQQLRNELFGLLRQAIADCVRKDIHSAQVLAYARIYFFTLHGIIGTYNGSAEPLPELMERLEGTFELSIDVLLAGFKQIETQGDDAP